MLRVQAMAALGQERAFLADTTQKLDTSLVERERLLAEVSEAKEKVCIYRISAEHCWNQLEQLFIPRLLLEVLALPSSV